MKKYLFAAFALFLGLGSVMLLTETATVYADLADNKTADAEQIVRIKMETTMGEVLLELYPDKAPKTVKNFLSYTHAGTYDGTIFHRVIKGFMNQGGGYNADYEQAEMQQPIPNEAYNGLRNLRGTIAMARTRAPHSATSQFFINTANNTMLDHTGKNISGWGYAVFGKVVSGMEVIDKMAGVPTGAAGPFSQDAPLTPIVILKMTEVKSAGASIKAGSGAKQ